MNQTLHSTSLLLAGLLVLSNPEPGASATQEDSDVIASYRSSITQQEFESWLRYKERGGTTADRQLLLGDLILAKSLAAEAVRLGIARDPQVLLELELSEAAVAGKALRRSLHESAEPSEAQVEAKYHAIKDTYTHPRRVRLRNLYKRYPPNASAAEKAAVLSAMQQLRLRALRGEDFGEIAATESDSQTRFQKGLLGNVPAGTFPEPIDTIAMAMEPGEISDILSSKNGLTILYCEDIREKVTRSPEELRQVARKILHKQAFKSRWDALQSSLLASLAPVYKWDVLSGAASDSHRVAVELANGETLSRGELEMLLKSNGAKLSVVDTSQHRLRKLIERHVLGKAHVAEVKRRGLTHPASVEEDRTWLRIETLATKARLRLVENRFTPPSETQIHEYFLANREQFTRLTHYDLSAILLPLSNAEEETHRTAELIVHQIRTGSLSFEEAARQYSDHSSAQGGGHLGWISRQILPHRFGFNVLRALLKMQPSETSDVIVEGNNLWLIRLNGLELPRPLTYEESQAAAADRLGSERARLIEREIIEEWINRLGVNIQTDF